MATQKKPEKKIRIGLVTGTIWLNEPQGKRPFRTVDVQRSYRDGETWKSNSTFTLSDLPQAFEVLRIATNYVAEMEADVTEN